MKVGTVVQAVESYRGEYKTITKNSLYVVHSAGSVMNVYIILDDEGRNAVFHEARFKIIVEP